MGWLRRRWAWAKGKPLLWANPGLITISVLLIFLWPGPSDLRLKLIALQKLSRTSGGLYFISPRSRDYISYHEDGKYWIRSQGKHFVKKIRQPLCTFAGIETLSMATISVFASMPDDRDEADVSVKKEDIVIDFGDSFCVEITLSESVVRLPDLPERINARVFVKNWKPAITVEAFEPAGNVFPTDRYSTSSAWVEGTNFFVDHTGKI